MADMPEKNSKHDGMIRGYYHLAEAWYADANLANRRDGLLDEVMIGFYAPNGDGGTTGEFSVTWTRLSGNTLTPRLEVFDDSWEALSHFSDLLAEMAKLNDTDPSPSDFCELLKRLGMKDLTPREGPRNARNRERNARNQESRS